MEIEVVDEVGKVVPLLYTCRFAGVVIPLTPSVAISACRHYDMLIEIKVNVHTNDVCIK